ISVNKIKSIDKKIKNLENLEELIIDSNKLKRIPKEINDLKKLKILSIF
ncbi:leucine-rich repeat domain-containing protein, partial [Brachyspira hampsonii]|nr:leucine-rich repeat domain-containing protein [Brachyspira hampsonii]